MLRTLINQLDHAVVATRGLGGIVDRVGTKLLPHSVAEAASTSSCIAYACRCPAAGHGCTMQLICPDSPGLVCGEYCGMCQEPL